MPRYIAFLRAINVGGHTVKMDRLRQLFESFGFSDVETFIASGNVIFNSSSKNPALLEKKIAAGLRDALGYEVATFVRTPAELAAIADYQAFSQTDLDSAAALNVAFLAGPVNEEAGSRLMALRTAIDNFSVHKSEVYWLCRRKQSESTFSNVVLEKAIQQPSTLRGINMIRKLAGKFV